MNVPDNIFENRIIQMTPHLHGLGDDSHYPSKMILFYFYFNTKVSKFAIKKYTIK